MGLAPPVAQSGITITWPTAGNTITTTLGKRYLVGPRIGNGGYSLVFEGSDLQTQSQVVFKVYQPANRSFEDVQTQWKRECALCAKVNGHPNIVVVMDAFICDNLFYIVFERAWGNLSQWIDATPRPLPEFTVLQMAHDILAAMSHIHSRAIVHRDITIFNVLVFQGLNGAIFKVSDFGISKEFVDPWVERVCRTQIAHPLFVPPELLFTEFGQVTERSDLYHLGLILLFALTGRLPLVPTMSHEQIAAAIKAGQPRLQAEAIHTPLGDFIAVLLRRRQQYRFASAADAYSELCRFHPFEPLISSPASLLYAAPTRT
jgi:serine/threonine protein kinase